jgi:hypothetical protein
VVPKFANWLTPGVPINITLLLASGNAEISGYQFIDLSASKLDDLLYVVGPRKGM